MALTPGTRIGSYEVVALLGEGGMGQVYRARDGKLNREVALKILPELFTADPDRLARFRREAQVLASLNHPHIAQIYGFEDSGATHALVLELVPGQTLADRLAAGPLPLAEALLIARQIADSLAAAHDAGVIHRDLKPANIKVTDDGIVKVLDFGLAKAMATGSVTSSSDVSSLTMTSPAMTQMGMILGTAAYMSPEQARGKTVDRRADVWAFGCVLYEMLTGRRAFAGDEVTDVLAAVLKESPALDALPAGSPPQIRRLLRRCFEKDRARRLDSLSVARL
jgi:serine/threonine protein kinase